MESQQQHVLAAMDMAQVGVRTRAQAALAMAAASTSPAPTSKRRKINHTNEHPKFSTSKSRSSAAAVKTDTTAVLPVLVTEERCSSPTSDEFPASCCSSNGSVGLDEERIKLLDLEVKRKRV